MIFTMNEFFKGLKDFLLKGNVFQLGQSSFKEMVV